MNGHKEHEKMKIIDVEAIDEQDDGAGGPVDTVDIMDEITEGIPERGEPRRHKKLEDFENPFDNEDKDILQDNLYQSEPDSDESD